MPYVFFTKVIRLKKYGRKRSVVLAWAIPVMALLGWGVMLLLIDKL